MRIAIAGTQCIGKSTLIDDMIKEWPMYKRSNESYRPMLKSLNLPANTQTTKDTQGRILDCLCDDIKATNKNDNIIFDRTPIDNIVYSLWALEKGYSDIDKAFIDSCVDRVKESMRSIDILFFLPITKVAPVEIVAREGRETDATYRTEIDNIFKAIQFSHNKGKCPFFMKDDAPPIIEIFGNPLERIQMLKLYINVYGEVIDTVASVMDPKNLYMMEELLGDQKDALTEEQKIEALKGNIIQSAKSIKLQQQAAYEKASQNFNVKHRRG